MPKTGIHVRGEFQELCHGQPAASFATQHLRPWLAGALQAVRLHREAGAGRQEAGKRRLVTVMYLLVLFV